MPRTHAPLAGGALAGFDAAHRKRNLAEYEGFLDIEESGIAELCALVDELIVDVTALIDAPTA